MARPSPATGLRAVFDALAPLTVGLEEELFLLDPATLDLLPAPPSLLDGLDDRFKGELPAAGLEIVTPPCRTVGEAIGHVGAGRRALTAHLAGRALPAALAVHPFALAAGELREGGRYDAIRSGYAGIARRQLVCALQVHVAVGGADRTIAVHDAVRSYLPLVAALAAAAPHYEGADTGLASIRPSICRMLPRQGVPPVLGDVEAYAAALAHVGDAKLWWWEVRPHPFLGTLEIRVPDAQPWLADAAAVAAVVHCLVAWLSERHDAGELPEPEPAWMVEERRWLAARHGAEGPLADALGALLGELEPVAARLGCAAELAEARRLAAGGAAARLRELGAQGAARAAADAFTADDDA